jgi:uncharacterized OB-fold protein
MSTVDEKTATAGPYETYRAALDARRLTFQRCRACSGAWLPPREDCPRCWSPDWGWEEASGKATVVSWVVYHTAFDKRFSDRLPYNVTLVELDEGPRMVTNLIDIPAGQDVVGRRAVLVFEEDFGRQLPRYRLEKEAPD